jgi:hypothetical protein
LKLRGTQQLLFYADNINTSGRSVHTSKKHTVFLIVTNKENGLEVNADKIKYMVISRDQNSGLSHNKKIDNR